MLHVLSIWLHVAAFFGAGLFNAIGMHATKSDFARRVIPNGGAILPADWRWWSPSWLRFLVVEKRV
jgi:hypothetical protein